MGWNREAKDENIKSKYFPLEIQEIKPENE